MKIRVDDPGGGSIIYVELNGTLKEIEACVAWAREHLDPEQVFPYRSAWPATHHVSQTIGYLPGTVEDKMLSVEYHTTIMMWRMSDVLLFKLTWA